MAIPSAAWLPVLDKVVPIVIGASLLNVGPGSLALRTRTQTRKDHDQARND